MFATVLLMSAAFSTACASTPDAVVVAIAWRADPEDGFCQNLLRALDAVGAEVVMLDQVVYGGMPYEAGNAGAGEEYNATRDVSDYILMRHCLEYDIPVFGICRGMQMLAVVSGGTMLQDIPAYYAEMGKVDRDYLRMPVGKENRDYVAHDVDTLKRDSLMYAFAQTDVMENAPAWHHQSVQSVEGTPLLVTASTTCDGIEIIEAIERTDRSFALGLQFHLEAAIVKAMDGEANAADYTDADECLAFFERLLEYVVTLQEAEEAV